MVVKYPLENIMFNTPIQGAKRNNVHKVINPVETNNNARLRRLNRDKFGKKSIARIAATVPAVAAEDANAKLKIIPIDC